MIATEARAIEVLHDRIDGRFLRACQLMFECQGRVVVSTSMPDTVATIARKHRVPARVIGSVGAAGDPLQITTSSSAFSMSLETIDNAYHETLPRIMSTPVGN